MQWKEGLAAKNADEITQLRTGQMRNKPRGRKPVERDNREHLELWGRNGKNSLRLDQMIRPKCGEDIVSEIRADQNTRNRENCKHSQRDTDATPHCLRAIAPVLVHVKERSNGSNGCTLAAGSIDFESKKAGERLTVSQDLKSAE